MRIDLSMSGTQVDLAYLVGVSQSAISHLMTEGKIPTTGSLGALVLAYCQRLRDQAAGRMGAELGGLDLVQERAALAREQRLGIEFKNTAMRSEFAAVDLLSGVLETVSQSVVAQFEQMPELLKKACPDLPDTARLQVMAALASARNEWVRATESLVLAKAESDLADDDDNDVLNP